MLRYVFLKRDVGLSKGNLRVKEDEVSRKRSSVWRLKGEIEKLGESLQIQGKKRQREDFSGWVNKD